MHVAGGVADRHVVERAKSGDGRDTANGDIDDHQGVGTAQQRQRIQHRNWLGYTSGATGPPVTVMLPISACSISSTEGAPSTGRHAQAARVTDRHLVQPGQPGHAGDRRHRHAR